MYLVSYYLLEDRAFCAQAKLEYDGAGAARPGGPGQTAIESWHFTEKGNLLFELALAPLHEDGHSMLRAQPLPQAFQSAAAQYLNPVGYRDNDLFSKNWQDGDMGGVCLNDALDAMVRLAAGQDYAPADPAAPSLVPADEFEQALCRYLPVTPAQVRAQAAYNAGAGGYTYFPYGVSYWAVLPEMVPEVTEVRGNADGTLTLAEMCIRDRCNATCKLCKRLYHRVRKRERPIARPSLFWMFYYIFSVFFVFLPGLAAVRLIFSVMKSPFPNQPGCRRYAPAPRTGG